MKRIHPCERVSLVIVSSTGCSYRCQRSSLSLLNCIWGGQGCVTRVGHGGRSPSVKSLLVRSSLVPLEMAGAPFPMVGDGGNGVSSFINEMERQCLIMGKQEELQSLMDTSAESGAVVGLLTSRCSSSFPCPMGRPLLLSCCCTFLCLHFSVVQMRVVEEQAVEELFWMPSAGMVVSHPPLFTLCELLRSPPLFPPPVTCRFFIFL